jgi:hypothetical protein
MPRKELRKFTNMQVREAARNLKTHDVGTSQAGSRNVP